MQRVLSTHLFLSHRLHPGLLEEAGRAGAQAIELFAARQHFDYTSREHVTELAEWFRSAPVEPFSMHAPLFPDREMGRAGAPGVNVLRNGTEERLPSKFTKWVENGDVLSIQTPGGGGWGKA